MIIKHPSTDRGRTTLAWLEARHSFSFGHYYNPRHLGIGALRVLNHDRIAPQGGFPTHPHDNMEIITIPLHGQLSHQDSTGTAQTIDPNHIQVMTAGAGIRHSEFNPSETAFTELLQIWLIPTERNLSPSYNDYAIDQQRMREDWTILASHDPHRGHQIHAKAELARTVVPPNKTRISPLGELAYAYVISGKGEANDVRLAAGDAIILKDEHELTLRAHTTLDILLFQL